MDLNQARKEYEDITREAAGWLFPDLYEGDEAGYAQRAEELPLPLATRCAMVAIMSLAKHGREMVDEIRRIKYGDQPETAERTVIRAQDGVNFFFEGDHLWDGDTVIIQAGQRFIDAGDDWPNGEDWVRARYAEAEQNLRRYKIKRIAVWARGRCSTLSTRVRALLAVAATIAVAIALGAAQAAGARLISLWP